MMYHEGLEKLLEKFKRGESVKSAISFIGLCLLYKKGKYEFTINDLYDEINNLLKKFNNVSNDVKVNIMSFGHALKDLQLFDLIDISLTYYNNRKKYRIKLEKINEELINLYFGKFIYELLEKYIW